MAATLRKPKPPEAPPILPAIAAVRARQAEERARVEALIEPQVQVHAHDLRLIVASEQKRRMGQHAAAIKDLMKYEDRMAGRREAAWQERATSETLALAQGRGETAELQQNGQIRIPSRDGLHSAFRSQGGLSQQQYDNGLSYREAWQKRTADVGSAMGDESSRTGHDNGQFVATRAQRAFDLDWLGRVDRAVALECRAEPAALQMLRAVAGDGKCLSVFGEGRAHARHMAALKLALDVAGKTPRRTTR